MCTRYTHATLAPLPSLGGAALTHMAHAMHNKPTTTWVRMCGCGASTPALPVAAHAWAHTTSGTWACVHACAPSPPRPRTRTRTRTRPPAHSQAQASAQPRH